MAALVESHLVRKVVNIKSMIIQEAILINYMKTELNALQSHLIFSDSE